MKPVFMQTFTGFDIGVPCGFELIKEGWMISDIEPYNEILWNDKVYSLCMATVEYINSKGESTDEPMKWQVICEESK